MRDEDARMVSNVEMIIAYDTQGMPSAALVYLGLGGGGVVWCGVVWGLWGRKQINSYFAFGAKKWREMKWNGRFSFPFLFFLLIILLRVVMCIPL